MASRRAFCLCLPALLLSPLALAQPVIDPANIMRGYLRHGGEMAVMVNGNPMRLAPGAIIRNEKKLIVVPTAMPSEGAWADYVVDKSGQIFRAWLLTADELSQPPKRRNP